MQETNYIKEDGSIGDEGILSMKKELGQDKMIVITMYMKGDNLREISYIVDKDVDEKYHIMAYKEVSLAMKRDE